MRAGELLQGHAGLRERREQSSRKLEELTKELNTLERVRELSGVTVFAAGSYGRLEAGVSSDLDLFVVANGNNIAPLDQVRLLASIADINDRLGFPPLDEEMRFFRIYTQSELIDHTGKPVDDTENSFTARMLLLLESRCVAGDLAYNQIAAAVANNYFRDNKGKKDFRPLFLLNDLLRYWRTLCLNYEGTRSDPTKRWRKKNLNLRFSRLSTVFSTVVALLAFRPGKAEGFLPLVSLTPFERLARSLDQSGDPSLTQGFNELLDNYEWFLRLKDEKGTESILTDDSTKIEARQRAESISCFFSRILNSEAYKDNARYLTL
ncbi:hypothetical protein [Marilutibacter chinensis]|uniref:Polymerase nucleotidyl transferase domain-containing protein n=1 Tax=Marilutibacter chinensis TaxID=2912247 RepID=A0ABS9HP64_9GAMM|nr:hypothetical protein [Lysobacter chinensis]MCF7220761.1 hypothetical protein [Lysobacter chinensis]